MDGELKLHGVKFGFVMLNFTSKRSMLSQSQFYDLQVKGVRSPQKDGKAKEVEKCKDPEGKGDTQIHIKPDCSVSNILKFFTMNCNTHS